MNRKEEKKYMNAIISGDIKPTYSEEECWSIRWLLGELLAWRKWERSVKNHEEFEAAAAMGALRAHMIPDAVYEQQ